MILPGPYVLNGQITMNGLADMVNAVSADVAKLTTALADSKQQIAALKAELDQVKSTLARIDQAVTPATYKSQTALFR